MRRAPPAPDDPERLTRWWEPGWAASTVDSALRDIDRNLNTGHELGADAEMRPALQTIFHDREHPSRLVLPVVPR
jgi:predicted acyl esterase